MNETLKAVGNIGAELAEAKAEIQRQRERHRTTWTQLEQVQRENDQLRTLIAECAEYLNTDRETSIGSGSILHRELIAALSQQAEPVEPAPAQDERVESYLSALEQFECEGETFLRLYDVRDLLAELKRPAQAEQQPERWLAACGDWRETNLAIHGERSGYIACGIPEDKAHAIIKAHNIGLPEECAASHAMDAKEE